jgi:hypothetical protein
MLKVRQHQFKNWSIQYHSYFNLARKEDDPKEALIEFQSVVDTEETKGDW